MFGLGPGLKYGWPNNLLHCCKSLSIPQIQPGPIANSNENLESGAINTTAITICVQDLPDPSVHAGHIFVVDERAQ